MAEITVHLTAQGRVQGVGFRYSVSQLAIRHHLTGFARNEVNGDVTIVLQGSPSMIELVTEAIKASPNSWSHVTTLASHELPHQPFKKFDIY